MAIGNLHNFKTLVAERVKVVGQGMKGKGAGNMILIPKHGKGMRDEKIRK